MAARLPSSGKTQLRQVGVAGERFDLPALCRDLLACLGLSTREFSTSLNAVWIVCWHRIPKIAVMGKGRYYAANACQAKIAGRPSRGVH